MGFNTINFISPNNYSPLYLVPVSTYNGTLIIALLKESAIQYLQACSWL